jgi:hypothetical protein
MIEFFLGPARRTLLAAMTQRLLQPRPATRRTRSPKTPQRDCPIIADCPESRNRPGLLDDPKNTDYANARLIAAAPDLRAVVQTAKSAFGERHSCLRGERREVLRFDGDVEDIDDQIGHYEALIAKCTAALEKTTAG